MPIEILEKNDSFSIIHALAYSFIGAQTLTAAVQWNPIYWDTACLIVNSGAIDPAENNSSNYSKIAKAVGDIISSNIKISLVDINKSDFGFKPDVENNQILFGLKGISNVGNNVINEILEKRPFSSFKDYLKRVESADKRANIMLIKAGAFDCFEDRKFLMAKYIWDTCDKKTRLTLQNMPTLIAQDLIPEELTFEKQVFGYNKYLKTNCKQKEDFKLDTPALNFFSNHFDTNLLKDNNLINQKVWDKIYQKQMDKIRNWLRENGKEILFNLNSKIFLDDWNKYAKGTLSTWEMDALCFYYHEHELKNLNKEKYGISDFDKLSPEPQMVNFFIRNGKKIPLYEIKKICGTCIAKDKVKSTVSLLTTNGVVSVKFRKEYFSMFDKQISEKQSDGKKKVLEKSWFNKGNMIIVQGIRRGDDFIVKKYSSTPGHELYKIEEVDKDGNVVIRSERKKGVIEDDEE